jgi:hypothetical protein
MHSTKLLQYLCVLKTRNNRTNFQFSEFVLIKFLIFFFFFDFSGKPFFLDEHISEEAGPYIDNQSLPIGSPARSSPHSQGSEGGERFSRKVFVGGLPPDIDEGKRERYINYSHL